MKDEVELKKQHDAVIAVVEKVRPYVQMHGGDVSVLSIVDGIVTISISGACTHCSLADLTYNKMVRSILCKEVPGIIDVVVNK